MPITQESFAQYDSPNSDGYQCVSQRILYFLYFFHRIQYLANIMETCSLQTSPHSSYRHHIHLTASVSPIHTFSTVRKSPTVLPETMKLFSSGNIIVSEIVFILGRRSSVYITKNKSPRTDPLRNLCFVINQPEKKKTVRDTR